MRVVEQIEQDVLAESLEREWYRQAAVMTRAQIEDLRGSALPEASIHPCCPYTKVDAPINPPRPPRAPAGLRSITLAS